MQRKFFRTVAISIVFIGVLGTIGQDSAKGMYTGALEDEITINRCRNLLCKQTRMGYNIRPERNDEDGWQAHKCVNCDTNPESPEKFGPTFFTIERSGIQPKIIINYEFYECKHPVNYGQYFNYMCNNPVLSGEMKRIWDKSEILHENRCGIRLSSYIPIPWKKGLESLWAAAWILDNSENENDGDFISSSAESSQYSFPEIVSEFHHKCGCCCTIM